MRILITIMTICLVLLLALHQATAAQAVVGTEGNEQTVSFPYQAIVNTDGSLIRSGPGQVHYATARLDLNATVEVFRHDPGGWCAIRPLEDSFSLIPESAIELTEEGIGRITESGTQAWVGTQLGPVDKPLWQVKLDKNETVRVLGQASWPDPEGYSTVWYQIAPPSGEFRWIHINDIKQPPALISAVPQSNLASSGNPNHLAYAAGSQPGSRNTPAAIYDTRIQPAAFQTQLSQETSAPLIEPIGQINQGWRQVKQDRSGLTETQPSNSYPVAGTHPRYASRFDLVSDAANQLPAGFNSSFGATDGSTLPSPPADQYPRSTRLMELELKLNHQLVKQPEDWRLAELKSVANSIYEGTPDPVERVHAQSLIAKLEKCQSIKSGFLGNRATLPSDRGEIGTGVNLESNISLGTTYDAHGWLNELVRQGGMQESTYVLQDENGKITHHVSASPGFNLRPFLKAKVGIIGQRGFHTELKLDHVTAERVIELKRR